MKTDGKITIAKDDQVTIIAQGRKVSGKVLTADYWGENDGWYIELIEANVPGEYSYWKQGLDGGKIIKVNNKEV